MSRQGELFTAAAAAEAAGASPPPELPLLREQLRCFVFPKLN